ncbi:MAG: flagellin, partial [Rhodoferax sp.]
ITATSANFSTNKYGNNRIGSVVAGTAGAVGDLVTGSLAGATATIAGLTSSAIAGETLTINGALGTANATIAAGASAKAAAAVINAQAGTTGVSATARTQIDATTFAANGSYSLAVVSDNVAPAAPSTITFTVGPTGSTADGLAAAITAFNDKSSSTGVTAKINIAGDGITLTNASGSDIQITNSSAASSLKLGTQAVAAAAVGYATGALTLDSDKTYGITSTVAAAAGKTGFFVALANASQLQAASTLDVSTVDSATRTLSTVDAALSAVNGQRANYGALQSRFDTTIANLQVTSENLSASRSRIQDADFAQETANLSRAQILQQAGTAMVAQANQIPQGVLALLK